MGDNVTEGMNFGSASNFDRISEMSENLEGQFRSGPSQQNTNGNQGQMTPQNENAMQLIDQMNSVTAQEQMNMMN